MDALKEANYKLLSESGDPELIRGALEARDRHNGLAAQRIAELMAQVEKLQDENAKLRIDLHEMKEVGGACDEVMRNQRDDLALCQEAIDSAHDALTELTRQRDYLALWMDDMAKSIPQVAEVLEQLSFWETYGADFLKQFEDEEGQLPHEGERSCRG